MVARPRNLIAALLLAGLAVHAALASPVPSPATEHDSLVARLDAKETRAAARDAIVQLGPDALALLEHHSESASFTVRWEVANICGLLRDPRCASLLARLVVNDPSPHVRWRSLWGVKALPSAARDEAVAALRVTLAADREPATWNAAVGLAALDDASGLELLHSGLARPDGWQRWEAINALGRVHDERSASALAPLARSCLDKERKEAMLTLGLIADERARGLLRQALADPSAEVRWRACQSLGRMRDGASASALVRLAADDPSPLVREHASKALAAVGQASRP